MFDPPLNKIMDLVEKDFDDFNEKSFRATALDLFSAIVKETPVYTGPDHVGGSARGGWQASIGSPVFKQNIQPNPAFELPALKKNPKLLNYILSNPLPYIEKLEFGGYGPGPRTQGGFSKLAPRGMIRVNMQERGLL